MIANLVFDIPAEERAFMRAARADELYECLMDIKRMAYGAAGKHSAYFDDSDALSAIRSRLNRLKTELGDLG